MHSTQKLSLSCSVHLLLFLSCHLQGYMEQDVYNILLRILSIQEWGNPCPEEYGISLLWVMDSGWWGKELGRKGVKDGNWSLLLPQVIADTREIEWDISCWDTDCLRWGHLSRHDMGNAWVKSGVSEQIDWRDLTYGIRDGKEELSDFPKVWGGEKPVKDEWWWDSDAQLFPRVGFYRFQNLLHSPTTHSKCSHPLSFSRPPCSWLSSLVCIGEDHL